MKKNQVFTPKESVIELLDLVGYKKKLFGKKILENSCGDGNILIEIVKRYIEDSLMNRISLEKIKFGLENDIYGFEIDIIQYNKCILKLDCLAKIYKIYKVKWNIKNTDFLKEKNLDIKFDFIVGNPPYINYREIDLKNRIFLKENFYTCSKGKFDYCYAFIESSLNLLNKNGKLSYLIPNSIFKNVFAENLREKLLYNLIKVVDYKNKKLFKNVLTSSAIIVCSNKQIIDYIEYFDKKEGEIKKILKYKLKDKWVFEEYEEKKRRFGDFFKASISIATLYNKAYILKSFKYNKKYINIGCFGIEKNIVRECASPRSLGYGRKELIIFPYKYNNKGEIKRYKKEEFENKFPKAVEYLKGYSFELSKRNVDKNTEWFEYGRSQALAHLNQEKLILSTIITNKVKVYKVSKNCIPYSGIYIVSKGDLSLDYAKDILESKEFLSYINLIGINANGNSIRITANDINNFKF